MGGGGWGEVNSRTPRISVCVSESAAFRDAHDHSGINQLVKQQELTKSLSILEEDCQAW